MIQECSIFFIFNHPSIFELFCFKIISSIINSYDPTPILSETFLYYNKETHKYCIDNTPDGTETNCHHGIFVFCCTSRVAEFQLLVLFSLPTSQLENVNLRYVFKFKW